MTELHLKMVEEYQGPYCVIIIINCVIIVRCRCATVPLDVELSVMFDPRVKREE